MIRIVTDSMSDYHHFEGGDQNVIVVAQPFRFGVEQYLDDGGVFPLRDFYARMRTATELPKTSMVPMQAWKDAFKAILMANDVDNILCITGSSELSGCYQSAVNARESCLEPERITVVDSLSAACGQTMLINRAAEMRDAGASMAQVVAAVEDLKAHTRLIGLADDLKYLVMGGRLSPLIGKVGNALSIKPTLMLQGGRIENEGMVRGLKKGYAWYIEQLKAYPPKPGTPVYIGGADCADVTAMLKGMVEAAGIPNEVRCMPVGCVIGTHVGPGLTLVAWEKAN